MLELLTVADAEIAVPEARCTNDECREYVKTGRRRFVGQLLPGCRAQCRVCGTWVFGVDSR